MLNRRFADPYVIAEIGMNYEGSMARAKSMISAVARAGGHAAKFQTYKAATLASATDSPAYWDTNQEPTTSQFELFRRYDAFGQAEYEELAAHCAEVGVDFLSTPFDLESVDMLAPLMPAIKIASADLTNIPLLRRVGSKSKPVILSVGAATHDEIDSSLSVLEKAGANNIALLHCVLRYPTPPEHANLLGLSELQRRFGRRAVVGYSDHVAPEPDGSVPALQAAVVLGARVIEKHFTDDRSGLGNDHYHAFDESGLRTFTKSVSLLRTLGGTGEPDLEAQSAAIVNARRRIFTKREMAKGAVLREEDLLALRANTGIEVAQWDDLVGRTLATDVAAGAPVSLSDLA